MFVRGAVGGVLGPVTGGEVGDLREAELASPQE